MKLSDYKRDPNGISKYLVDMGDSGLISKKDCFLLIPKSWEGTKLLSETTHGTYVFGMFALFIDNKYTIFKVFGLLRLDTVKRSIVNLDNVECIRFDFSPEDKILTTMTIPQNQQLQYTLGDVVFSKGKKIPYFNYNDYILIFDGSNRFTGIKQPSAAALSVLLSHLFRSEKDPRILAKDLNIDKDDLILISMRDPNYAPANIHTQISGGYVVSGIANAINTELADGEKESKIPKLLSA